ncbi:MAG: dihydrodipicolinate synthase family protein [Deltaproteobacteria bacterium]|nr:dihydrodipicolinate synthase family protein [Deltaproteobacteria bacterium]MBI2348918.1 dihydrodipicolinate synthase family protein [Deltaproteobacteria bacterium]
MARDDRFEGLFVPQVTPFDDSGAVDLQSLERLCAHLCSVESVTGLVSCARIGEGPVLSLEEKRDVYRVAGRVARAAGKLHVAAITPQSTDEAIAIVRDLEKLPVDAAMIFPPLLLAWGKVGADLKFRFFEDIAESTSLPIVLFQIPVASYWYDAETVCRIAEIGQVVAYKEASFNINLFSETLRQLEIRRSPMTVLTGNDRFVAQSYMLGARGALIGVSNLATEKWGAMDRAGRSGDFRKAMSLQEGLSELKELVFSEPIVEAVSRIKVILKHQGLIQSSLVRRPQLGVSGEEEGRLIASFGRIVEESSVAAKGG